MKKNKHIFKVIPLVLVLLLTACAAKPTDSELFAKEYSDVNGTESKSGKVYKDVNLPKDHVFKTESDDAVLKLLTSGTGVVYFGFPTCPWCRTSIEIMDEAAKAVSLNAIYQVNVLDIRDQKERDTNGNIVTVNEGTQFYRDLLDVLGDWAPEYSGLNDPTVRRIHTPLLVVVVDGKIVASHSGTVESIEDPFLPTTQQQHDEMLQVFKDLFSQIPGCGENKDEKVC